ncbi:type II secretion system protein [Candidatus Saccharibacteria bacterium]|nr:type II secretion system protein [Candidatus Saccharibacteria bacterium]
MERLYQKTNQKVRSTHSAFTLVEVALVIAISSLMLLAFIGSVAGRIGAQRYRDATNSFADFIRTVYSEVINVENSRLGQIKLQNEYCTLAGQTAWLDNNINKNDNNPESYPGRSGCAIYGKLISFGEDDKEEIYVYDVIGKASDFTNPIVGAATTIDELRVVYSDVLALVPNNGSDDNSLVSLSTAALSNSYTPQWGSRAENPDGSPFHASVLIVRAPSTGAVRTFYLSRTLPFHELLDNHDYHDLSYTKNTIQRVSDAVKNKRADLAQYLHQTDPADSSQAFVMQDIDFCVASGNIFSGFTRNNIRIKSDGHNSTAVEFVESDLPADQGGNRCRV